MFSLKFTGAQLPYLFMACLLSIPASVSATVVQMQTSLGNIDIQLFDTLTPKTVANFLYYVNKGAYKNSIFHRSVPGFIIQGGGYTLTANGPSQISTQAAVANEFKHSNVRGTIAMAKLGSDPNSATDQWFFNLADNSTNLDNQNGGFTVFGEVINNGMQVVDAIAALKQFNVCPQSDPSCAFNNLPVLTVGKNNYYVLVSKMTVTQTLADDSFQELASSSTTFTPPTAGVINNTTISNPQSGPVTVTLLKNTSTVFVVTVQAKSTLNIPLASGLAFTKTDSFKVNLPNNLDYSTKPLHIMFDFQ